MRCTAKAAALLIVSAAGCAGAETGNPFAGSLGYDAYSSRPVEVALRASASTRVDAAWLVLGDVTFEAADTCDAASDVAAQVPGLGAGDHAGTQAPATRFTLPEGSYCQVRLALESAGTAPAGAPPELAGHSMLLCGALPDDRSFEIASAYTGELSLRAPGGGFDLDATRPGVVIGFDLAAWVCSLPWGEATPDARGVIRVDPASNASLARLFDSRLAAGVALFRDDDADRQLDRVQIPFCT